MRRKTRTTLVVGVALCLTMIGATTGCRASGSPTGLGSAKPGKTASTANGATAAPSGASTSGQGKGTFTQARAKGQPPNVVLVLIDDLSANLIATMPQTTKLKHDAAYFPNAFVADSLCCTSRSAFLTGLYPHVNKVRTNTAGANQKKPVGGWLAFHANNDGKKTFVNAINHRKGKHYRTAFQGKYLNQYHPKVGAPVPPGWTQWNAIVNGGYREWGYDMTTTVHKGDRYVNGKLRPYGSQKDKGDKAYGPNVLSRRAKRYIDYSNSKKMRDKPYFLEIAPYSTHRTVGKNAKGPLFPAALADRPHKTKHGKTQGNCGRVKHCNSLQAGDLPGFNNATKNNRPQFDDGSYAKRWQNNTPMGKKARKLATRRLRDRARMAQAVDRMIGKIRRTIAPNTYLIVTSDNGFHLGQHRSRIGKGTAYDYDVRVPLIVYKKAAHASGRLKPGPRPQVVSNIDIAPTIRELTHTSLAKRRNGLSFASALRNPNAKGARYAFVEHTKAGTRPGSAKEDPDYGGRKGATSQVPSYIAVRSKKGLLIRYTVGKRHAWEFYKYHRGSKNGLVEGANTYHHDMKTTQVKQMKKALKAFDHCHGKVCRTARRVG